MDNIIGVIDAINEQIKNEKTIQTVLPYSVLKDFKFVPKDMKTRVVWKGEIDEHRWYGTQEVVLKFYNETEEVFVKSYLVTQSYSEQQSISDIDWIYPAFEVVKPKTVTTTIYE